MALLFCFVFLKKLILVTDFFLKNLQFYFLILFKRENVVDHLIDKQKHAAPPVKSAVDKFQLLPEFLKVTQLSVI
jgi:hypothetical protein